MRYLWQHLEQLLRTYDGRLPLHHFLKSHFKKHPKLGSRDRRGLSDAVYAWYRVGNVFIYDEHNKEVLRLAAMYLCGMHPQAFAVFVPEEWRTPSRNLRERLSLLEREGFVVTLEYIFPYDISFSPGIIADSWRASLLRQPQLFLRIRRRKAEVTAILQITSGQYQWLDETCLALPNGSKMEGLLPADSYVVQDASSQATGKYLRATSGGPWWDCCSGAGGKSLMLSDASPDISLLATDLRQSILRNLEERFRRYHLPTPEIAPLDAGDEEACRHLLGNRRFDGIICDVPCTGSGTWARTPENCYFFNPETLTTYTKRQKAILRNASYYLAPEGKIIYITCSVFRAENEEVIEAIAAEGKVKILSSGLINGLSIDADSLFVAELIPA